MILETILLAIDLDGIWTEFLGYRKYLLMFFGGLGLWKLGTALILDNQDHRKIILDLLKLLGGSAIIMYVDDLVKWMQAMFT